jgi:hypothetical protein
MGSYGGRLWGWMMDRMDSESYSTVGFGIGDFEPLGPAIFFFIIISGVGLSPPGNAATSGLLYKPQMIVEGDCGAIGGMKIGRGNQRTRRKPAPAPLCPSQIPHDQTRARTRAATVGSQRLTAWAVAWPLGPTTSVLVKRECIVCRSVLHCLNWLCNSKFYV